MRANFILFGLVFSLLACGGDQIFKKPENLITKPTMENILFDLVLMQSIRSSSTANDSLEGYLNDAYIYKKYGVDSIQLAESEIYYSRYPKIHLEIHKNVLSRLTHLKDSIETEMKNQAKRSKRPI